MTDTKVDLTQAPLSLSQPIKLLLALAALAASQSTLNTPSTSTWHRTQSSAWVQAICKVIELDADLLPPSALSEGVKESAADQVGDWTEEQRIRIAEVLVEASLASSRQPSPSKGAKQDEQLRYTPLARAWSYGTLDILGLASKDLVPPAEKALSAKLFQALKAAEDAETEKEVESTRASHSQGWGGTFGRHLATGAGVVAGGILVGVTGGLAAPAIAALLAPLGIGGLLAGGAAPVVLGTLFGVGGGGLAGKRVRERWKGVEEFSFIEVGSGTRATREEVEDLREARRRIAADKAAEEKEKEEEKQQNDGQPTEEPSLPDVEKAKLAGEAMMSTGRTGEEQESNTTLPDSEVAGESRAELEQRLLKLSLDNGSPTVTETPRTSVDSGRPTLEQGKEDESVTKGKKKAPSLTATIVVPGLLVISKTEAITAWRSICASGAVPMESEETTTHNPNGPAINYTPRRKSRAGQGDQGATVVAPTAARPDDTQQDTPEQSQTIDYSHLPQLGLRDGRDVYLLRFETDKMLKTGRDIDSFIGNKLLGKLKGEIIKRTALNAYFAAVKLPLAAYKITMMGFDNTWMQAQDRAKKAGRLLGEVLEKKVQGERPVVLIGTSLGAYTIMEALLYLASRPAPTGAREAAPTLVESAILISLPSAPTAEEWAKARSVVARRFVNAYSEQDLVLAVVARLHEVISRAATFSNGMMPAGLGAVEQPGIEDVDVSSVLKGHLELQAKIGNVIDIIGVDA